MIELSEFKNLVDRFYPPEHFPVYETTNMTATEMLTLLIRRKDFAGAEREALFSMGNAELKKLIQTLNQGVRGGAIFSLRSSCLRAIITPEKAIPRKPTSRQIKDLKQASEKLATIRRDLESLPYNLRDVANMLGVAPPQLDCSTNTETALLALEKHFDFIARWMERQADFDHLSASANRPAIAIARAAVTLQYTLAPGLPVYGTHSENIPVIQDFTEHLFELCRIQASVADVLRDHCRNVYWINGEIGFD